MNKEKIHSLFQNIILLIYFLDKLYTIKLIKDKNRL